MPQDNNEHSNYKELHACLQRSIHEQPTFQNENHALQKPFRSEMELLTCMYCSAHIN